jgi:hypothetical protein
MPCSAPKESRLVIRCFLKLAVSDEHQQNDSRVHNEQTPFFVTCELFEMGCRFVEKVKYFRQDQHLNGSSGL